MIKAFADPDLKDDLKKSAFDLTQDLEILEALADRPRVESRENSECGPEDFYLERNSYSQDKIEEILKSVKSETTAVSSGKSTKQNKYELKPVFDWLEKVNMTEYYELVIGSGYDTLEAMVKDSANLSLSVVNYITKPGHRRKFMFRLQEETSDKTTVVKSRNRPEKAFYKCCSSPGIGTQGIYSFPSLKDWLRDLKLDTYYSNFVNAGYEDYENLVVMANTDFALDSQALQNEVKIGKDGHVKKILRKLDADNMTFCSRRSMKIAFDEPKSAACESCGVF